MNCPVCNKEISLSTTFCEHCGFEIHILPNDVPASIKEMEEQRIKTAQQYLSEVRNEQQKLYNENINLVNQLEQVSKQLEETNQKLESANDEQNEINRQLEEQRLLLKTENDRLVNELQSEREKLETELTNHNKTKILLQEEVGKVQKLQQQLEDQKSHYVDINDNSSNGKDSINLTPVGYVDFVVNGKSLRKGILSGDNIFVSSKDLNCGISGKLFKITNKNGEFIINDMCGQTRTAHGKEISTEGKRINPGDVFTVGKMSMTFDIPDFNFDDLLL